MGRISLGGRIVCLALALATAGCGGSGPKTTESATASPALPAYTYDCRSTAATDTASPLPAGVTYPTMIVDGKYRDYRLFQPPTLDTTKPLPLVIVLHGTPIDAAGFEDIIHLQAEAAAAGFLAAYPDGCDQDWDETAKSYDVDFISKMLDQIESKFQVDQSRVYVVGASAGAFMAYRLACDLASRIAAVVSVTGSMWWNDCSPARPIPILEMHGTADTHVPYDGGRITYHSGVTLQPVMTVVQRWVALDGCTGSPAVSHSGITTTSLWRQCNGGAVVRLDTVTGGHHTWFGSAFDPVPGEPNANAVVWSFLKQFQLPATPTDRYLALVRGYWSDILAADVVTNGTNLAAKVCLGVPRPRSPSDLQLVDPQLCRPRAEAILAAQQKFLTELGTATVPPRFAADDQVFRTQIPKAIADVKAMISACATGSKQAVVDAANTYVGDIVPAVTDALDDVDPTVVHT